jgi:hypothetical protein
MKNNLDEFREKDEKEFLLLLMDAVLHGSIGKKEATEIVMNKLRQRDQERKDDRTIYNIMNFIVAILLLIILFKISH